MFQLIVTYWMRDRISVTVPDPASYIGTLDMKQVAHLQVIALDGD